MENFSQVDMENWSRADLYHHYTEVWPGCLVTLGIKVDITETVAFLKEKGLKLAPVLYHLATKVLCEQSNFRMGFCEGKLGYWDSLCPLYPVLNEDKNITFHSVPWHRNCLAYYQSYLEEAERNSHCKKAVCGEIPDNFVLISIVSGTSFESCTFSLRNAKGYLTPTIFIGKYENRDGRLLMPLSFCFNHAVADGYHVQMFFDSFQKMLASPQDWWEEE